MGRVAKTQPGLFERYFQKNDWKKFDTYAVTLEITDIVGGIPLNPELIETWVNQTNKKKSTERRKKIIEAHREVLEELEDESRESKGIGFHRVDGELVIEGRQLKAMLKEAANILREIVPTGQTKDGKPVYGIPQLQSKVADQVFVSEKFVSLGRDRPDDIRERPIHVMTAQGERDSIKVYEICYDAVVTFTLRRLRNKGRMAVPEEALMHVLNYGQSLGLGADRSQGYGTFKVIDIEKIEDEE